MAVLALVAPVLLRLFVVEALRVPAGGMYPSLLIDDHVFISKWGYGCEGCAPARGELIVFRYPDPDPNAPAVDYVKRVVALPGDTLEVEHGAPIINGWKVPRCRLGHESVAEIDGSVRGYEFYVEFLGSERYLVALEDDRDEGRQGPYRVAANEAWVLGDNRRNSADSRAWAGGRGAGVPFQNFRGPVRALWMPPERAGLRGGEPPVLPANAQALAPQLARCLAAAPTLADSTPPPP